MLWELVLDEDTALWGSEVGATLTHLLPVEGLVDNSNAGSSINRDSNHTRNVIQMTFSETFRSIKRINPDDHFFLEKLAWELEEVVVCLGSGHPIDLLHLLEVAPIAMSVHVVVLDQHLLTDMVLIQFIGHYVRSLSRNHVLNLVLLADDCGPRVQLLQIVHHCVLDVHINLREDVSSRA